MSALFFETSARSAIGLVRQGNEDSAFTSAQLIAVADGMGGHAAGEVASRIAVQVLHALTPTLIAESIDDDSVEDLLMHSLHSIDTEIAVVADEEIEKQGMGTTLTALLIRNNHIALLHVGDSRCYRLRGNTLEQLSNDHTVIQELLDQGAISQAEAAEHPQRSMLTQALRGDGDVTPVLQMYEVKKGDRYLLCSDGLSGVFDALNNVTALMFSENPKEPALILSAFRKEKNSDKPVLKAAFINGDIYSGDSTLKALTQIKTKHELIGEVIGLLQSPAKRVLAGLLQHHEKQAEAATAE